MAMQSSKRLYIYHIAGCLAFMALPLFLFPHPPEEVGFLFSRPTLRDLIANAFTLTFFYLNDNRTRFNIKKIPSRHSREGRALMTLSFDASAPLSINPLRIITVPLTYTSTSGRYSLLLSHYKCPVGSLSHYTGSFAFRL